MFVALMNALIGVTIHLLELIQTLNGIQLKLNLVKKVLRLRLQVITRNIFRASMDLFAMYTIGIISNYR